MGKAERDPETTGGDPGTFCVPCGRPRAEAPFPPVTLSLLPPAHGHGPAEGGCPEPEAEAAPHGGGRAALLDY